MDINVNNLTNDNKLIYYMENKKNMGVAYLLCFFLGLFGAHRAYLNNDFFKYQFIIAVFCIYFIFFAENENIITIISFLMILVDYFICIIDLFSIPKKTRLENAKLAEKLGIIDPKLR